MKVFKLLFLILILFFFSLNLYAFPKKKHSIIKEKLSKESYQELVTLGYYFGFIEYCNYVGTNNKKYLKRVKGLTAYTNWDLFLKFNRGLQLVEGDLHVAGIGWAGQSINGEWQSKPIDWRFDLKGCDDKASLHLAYGNLETIVENVILKFIFNSSSEEYESIVDKLLTSLKEDKKDDYSEIIKKINLAENLNSEIGINNSDKNIDKQDSITNSEEEVITKTDNEIKFYGSGTGFFISNQGHIATNNHVIHGCQYVTYKDEDLDILHNDTFNDLAILKSKNKPDNFISVTNRITPSKGQSIYVLGYPFGKITSSESKVTGGIVSSLQGLGNNYSQIQIDAAIQPGNSGGPVFDKTGELVGITVATADYKYFEETYGILPQNMNFAIKSSILRNFMESVNIKLTNNNPLKDMKTVDIVKAYDKATIYLECWSTDEKVAIANKGINVLVDTARKISKP